MGTEASSKGRLIALEGACGQELKRTARRLLDSLCRGELEGGISYWDASAIFAGLRLQDPSIPGPSPRILALLYAADLAFRLRWEIQPALEKGQCVVAAPYVHTVIGFGKAVGLPRRWLLELYRFAPKPQVCYRIQEGALADAALGKPSEGYFEFCWAAMRVGSPSCNLGEFHSRFRAYLDALERRRGCETVTGQLLEALASRP